MIKHIVMIKLKENDRAENAKKVKQELENLKGKIDEIKHYEVGLNISESPAAYDLVLVSEFLTLETLEIYRENPEHQKVLKFLRSVTESTAVVDYEF